MLRGIYFMINNQMVKSGDLKYLYVRIPSVVYSIQENTIDEHTQTHEINFIGSPGNLAVLSNPAVEA